MASTEGTTVTKVYTTAEPAPGYNVPVQLRTVTERTTFQDIDIAGCKKNGGLQVAVGVLCMIFGIVSICIDTYYGYLATPFWCGVWFIFAGGCGTRVSTQQGYMAQKTLSSYLALSSVAVMFATTLLIMMSIAVAREVEFPEPWDEYIHSYAQRVAIDSVLLFLSFVEIIAASQGMKLAQKTLREAKRQTTVTTQPIATVPTASAYPAAPGYPPTAYPPPPAAYPPGGAYPPAPGLAPYGYQAPYGTGPAQPPPPPYAQKEPQPGPNYGAVGTS